MTLIPQPYRVVHMTQVSGVYDPDTGNEREAYEPAVVRRAQQITQIGRRGSSHEVISAEFVDRVETHLKMNVLNPTLYKQHDRVLLNAEFDTSGDWVAGTGVAYVVNGDPFDERKGPWRQLYQQFGGDVTLRRAT